MKKTALLALSILALAGVRLEAGSAAADKNGRQDAAPQRVVVPFTAEYDNLIGGHFTCAGFRTTFDNKFPRDEQQCTITDLSTLPPGTYTGTPNYIILGMRYTWNSDFDGVMAHRVRLIVTDNGDGTGLLKLNASYDE
jgi:hypothetical protein